MKLEINHRKKTGKNANTWRLNKEEIENINRSITSTEIETVIKNLPTGLPWWRSG